MAVIFNDGVPAKITVADFKYEFLASFPKFVGNENDRVIANTIDTVYAMFNGVGNIWRYEKPQDWYDKTVKCYLHLAAWYITAMYPRFAARVQSTGGMMIVKKKIGDVEIHYPDTSRANSADEVLNMLRSNPFGNIALMMIRSAVTRFQISATHVVDDIKGVCYGG